MRITAGRYRGRLMQGPKTLGTRPMTDKVRAALFDILGPLDGLTVLDVYAGSGALSFEALSRGAAKVTAIESGRGPADSIRANCHNLGIVDNFQLYPVSVESFLARPTSDLVYDIILADPPYASIDQNVLFKLAAHLSKGGLLAVSHSGHIKGISLSGMKLILSRQYGGSALSFYR